MKALKTKVILSAAVLLFALVATIGSTYAWFTVSSTNTVNAMTLNVQTADSLLIRVAPMDEEAPIDINDASAYFTTLTAAQVQAEYTYTTWRLYPVTAVQTGFLTTNGALASLNELTTENTDYNRLMDALEVGTAGSPGADVNAATGKVIVLKFYVMSQSAGMDLYLNDLAVTINGTADPVKDQVIEAVRLSVQVGANPARVYSEQSDYTYAYVSGLPGYFSGTQDSTHFNTILGGGYTLVSSDSAVGSSVVIAALTVDTPTLVTCTIYVEGWDADTTNNINAADFNISFTFGII